MRFSPKVILILCFLSLSVSAQIVRMETVLGNIDIELHPDIAPNTVNNFLTYMNNGDFNNSFIHRNISNFVVQGGGFKFIGGQAFQIEQNPPVVNEYQLLNVRGTIAMAKPSNSPDGATSQWFFNVIDNSDTLSPDNAQNAGSGGFTVFGTVIDGMDIVDAMNALNNATIPIVINGTAFNFQNLPYLNTKPQSLTEDDAVILTNVFLLDEVLRINSGLSGAWFNPDTAGQGIMLEILPTLDSVFMAWFTHDTQAPMDTAVVGFAGNRWMSGLGNIDHETNTVTFDLIVTSDGLFDDSQTVTNSSPNTVGTLTISFTDCSNATATYNLIEQELSGTFPLARVATDNVALCQSLSTAAAAK